MCEEISYKGLPWTPGFPDMWGRKIEKVEFTEPEKVKTKRVKKPLKYTEISYAKCSYCFAADETQKVRSTYIWIGYGQKRKWDTTKIMWLCEECREVLNGMFKYVKV
jgi:hypothetical protein